MILVKNCKFLLCQFLDKISYEITFDNHLVRKQAFHYYQIIDFTMSPYCIFLKGLPMILLQKRKFPLCLFLDRTRLEIIFDDHLEKETFLDYKNTHFTQPPYWIFLKGLTHEFGSKLEILHLFFFVDILGLKIMSCDHLVKNQALVNDKKIDFKQSPH